MGWLRVDGAADGTGVALFSLSQQELSVGDVDSSKSIFCDLSLSCSSPQRFVTVV